ncbi:hypothetical protein AWM70_09025 [Paenibacillus yonginensis]|uniref:Uncharacterized protein n=1 Tax=Paenibacillus yonginensis TaxID=1462996 RepID=A0A1B1MZW9_9BACL|nr:hypothetical protein [Paenibacillus yonginensis]ANS74714.1 hypothetical protein AWM70_09025 [Paenibacillus yonginensis]
MLYVLLAIVILSLIVGYKMNMLDRKQAMITWMYGVVVNELFLVVSNHSVVKRAYNWDTLWPYLVYFNLMNPLLMLLAVQVMNKQTGVHRKVGVALLSSLVLTAGLYLLYPIRLLHAESVQPLVTVVLWMFALISMFGLVHYLNHSSRR